jgi:hypothetical protein
MTGHGHGHGAEPEAEGHKGVALLIAVLALFLALAETGAKGSQTEALARNVEAANLWAFFQARTIRQTNVRTAAEQATLDLATAPEGQRVAMQRQIEAWQNAAARWESEPETREGRRELMARAKEAETKRDTAHSAYHNYEIGSAAFQVAIVLASASIITGVSLLAMIAGGLGVVGLVLTGFAFWAPNALHLF